MSAVPAVTPCEARSSRRSCLLYDVDRPSAYVGFSMTRPRSYRGVCLDIVVLTSHRCHGSTGFTFHRKAQTHCCTTLAVILPARIALLPPERGNADFVPENKQADY